MKTTKDIIFETLLLEAEAKVKKLVKKGKSRKDATAKVAEDMDLDPVETGELAARVDAAPAAEMPAPADLAPDSNVINFKSPEEVEQASGMLMYKNIPWRMKSINPGFLSFDNQEALMEAKEALKRRWDFLEDQNRTVANIEFDNLDEYNKVLDFIRRSNFTVVPTSTDNLSEDIMDELAEAAGSTKGGRAKKISESDIVAKGHAYKAVTKGYSQLNEDNFSANNRDNRAVKVRKKWK
ncbi:hypothetical protein D3C87_583790 [compost metagenome]